MLLTPHSNFTHLAFIMSLPAHLTNWITVFSQLDTELLEDLIIGW
jgi:hypothetical protein